MPQVLETVFDLLVNHTRMLRWHKDAITRQQSEAAYLQARVVWRMDDSCLHRCCCRSQARVFI